MTLVSHPVSKMLIGCVGYFGFAQLGLLFAIPPGFASAIWPAAGFALALYITFGRWVLPGIFAGSVGANLLIASSLEGLLVFETWLLPAIIAATSVLQLILSKYLMRRWLTFPLTLHDVTFISRFFFIVGPLGCLTASLLSSITIVWINHLSFDHWLVTWFTWWVGDTLGVLFFTPILLILFNAPAIHKIQQPLRIVFPALALFIIMSSIFAYARSNFTQTRQSEFNEISAQFISQTKIYENTVKQYLYALSGVFSIDDNLSRQDYRRYVDSINRSQLVTRAVAWIPKVPHQQRADFEQSLKREGFSSYKIRSITRDNHIDVTPKQDYYLPVYYTEPLAVNQRAVGLDLKSHPIISSTLNQAIELNQATITPKLRLIQALDKFTGMIVYYPVFNDKNTNEFRGMVEVVLEVDQVFSAIKDQVSNQDFEYQVVWVDNDRESIAFQSNAYRTNAQFKHRIDIEFFNREYHFYFQSNQTFDSETIDWFSWIILVLGSLISLLCFVFIMLMTHSGRRLKQLVEERTHELEASNLKLHNANEAKSVFLSNMSQEYRAPLNAVIGFCQIAKTEVSDPVALNYFDKIESSAYLLVDIINSVLDYNKIKNGRFILSEVPFSLEDIANKVERLFSYRAERKGVEFNIIRSAEITEQMYGDPIRLEQVIVYLVENALKFTDQGEVQVAFDVEHSDNGDYLVCISIADQGAGIEEEKLRHIFDAIDPNNERALAELTGSRLGLAIIKVLVTMLGGTITVESVKNHGSEFYLTIPLKRLPSNKQIEPVYKQQMTTEKPYANITALLVEDNHVNQLIAKKLLEIYGVAVAVADDGMQALRALEKRRYDIIFMDLKMPNLDGFGAIEEIHKRSEWNNIPIVIISAATEESALNRANELGIEHFITKPYQKEQLLQVLQAYFVNE
ncbi:MAG: CHASE domain-containing protein [Gammaproteobacteria bacterium]|nr:CHASE domain-containing protein [Gammaproteobacteria bacterium]